MKKRMLFLGVLVIMGLVLYAGCGNKKIPYNALLYDNVADCVNEDFKKANITSGLTVNDEHLQKSYAWLIISEDDYINKTNESRVNVDFDKQMVVVYTFTTVYATRKYNLRNLTVENDILTVEYEIEKNNGVVGNATHPQQRWFMIMLDKVNVNAVDFIEKR